MGGDPKAERDRAYKSFEHAAQVCDALAEKAMTTAEAKYLRAAAREWRLAGAAKSQEQRQTYIQAANRHELHAMAASEEE